MMHRQHMTEADHAEKAEIERMMADARRRWHNLLARLRMRAMRSKK